MSMKRVIFTILLSILFFGCSTTTPSSHNNDNARWQQFKAKQAEDSLK